MSGEDEYDTKEQELGNETHLLRAEAQIAWLRWVGMAGWLCILLGTGDFPGWRVWMVYGGGLIFTLSAHLRIRHGLAVGSIGSIARITTLGDPLLTTAMCFVTGGLASVFFPFYYFTLLATAFRYGAREATVVLIFNILLAGLLYFAVPDANLNMFAVAVFYLAFSALLGVFLANWAQENLAVANERSRALQSARDRARMLLQRLINSQEEERKRIAGDIHDRMSGHLFSLRHNLDRIRDDTETYQRLQQPLEQLEAEVRDTSSEVRRLMNELRPTVLDELGLAPAMEEYLAELRETLPFEARFEIDPDLRSWRGHGDMAVFRIVQEALLNIRKHANARHVSIHVTREVDENGNSIVLRVCDDGTGFDPSMTPRFGHLGLLTMRERAEAVGGHLDIASTPGRGTVVTATIPE